MMDGRIALYGMPWTAKDFTETSIMAYTAKYASGFLVL